MKIVIDDKIPFLEKAFENIAETVFLSGPEITATDLQDAQALFVRTRTKVNKELLANTPVKFVGSATIGFDHVDLDWLQEKQIAFSNAPGCNAFAVMQYVICALKEIAYVQGHSLEGKVLGVVGVGNVGSVVAKAAQGLGMEVLLNDPPRAEIEGEKAFTHIEEIAKRADYISFHVPLQKDGDHCTYRMVNAHYLSLMRDSAWLINTSRGEVVDNTALLFALRSGCLEGAVLDVWENETSEINSELLSLVDISTPHIAGYSLEGKVNATQQIVRAWAEHFDIDALKTFSVDADLLFPPMVPHINLQEFDDDIAALLHALRCTYDLRKDSQNLKAFPAEFESLRSNYYFRREFSAHKVSLNPQAEVLAQRLKALGFEVGK
ncbi:MAG: 4-phosphoerythronate dehydrogenase [Fibrobacter sp.]|nr:4-phosphoerythronate dehydrogenase [Fibrobacter sp.]